MAANLPRNSLETEICRTIVERDSLAATFTVEAEDYALLATLPLAGAGYLGRPRFVRSSQLVGIDLY